MAEKAKIETENVFFLYQRYRKEYSKPQKGPKKGYLYLGEKGLDICAYLPHEFAVYFQIKNGVWGHAKNKDLILTNNPDIPGQYNPGPVTVSRTLHLMWSVKSQLNFLVEQRILDREVYDLKVLEVDKKNAHIGMFGARNRDELGKKIIGYLSQAQYCDVNETNGVVTTHTLVEHLAKHIREHSIGEQRRA